MTEDVIRAFISEELTSDPLQEALGRSLDSHEQEGVVGRTLNRALADGCVMQHDLRIVEDVRGEATAVGVEELGLESRDGETAALSHGEAMNQR